MEVLSSLSISGIGMVMGAPKASAIAGEPKRVKMALSL